MGIVEEDARGTGIGFATYFEPDFLPNHVVTEYWNGDELALLDAVAAATLEGRTAGYETDLRLQPTGEIRSYSAAGFYTLSLP